MERLWRLTKKQWKFKRKLWRSRWRVLRFFVVLILPFFPIASLHLLSSYGEIYSRLLELIWLHISLIAFRNWVNKEENWRLRGSIQGHYYNMTWGRAREALFSLLPATVRPCWKFPRSREYYLGGCYNNADAGWIATCLALVSQSQCMFEGLCLCACVLNISRGEVDSFCIFLLHGFSFLRS